MHMKALARAGLLFICVMSGAAAPRPPGDIPDFSAIQARPVPADSSVRSGVLPNGLRYAVRRADVPKGSVSIRLGVNAGSFDDPDRDLGVAHFVEHMAFRSTRHYPANSVDGAFSQSGVAFGRDQNAVTKMFTTEFSIDLPRTDAPTREKALIWLRDVADGVVFDPVAVEKERGVVLAEKEVRDTRSDDAYWALLKFRGPDLRSSYRPPIGLDSLLRTLSVERIKDFYQRWYRPDNAVVVMVGDLPLEEMETDLKRSFGSWSASGPAPKHAAYGSVDPGRGLDVFTTSDGADLPRIEICRLGPPEPRLSDDYADFRKAALAAIWREAINQRLAAIRLIPSNHVLGVRFDGLASPPDRREACLSINSTDSNWASALGAAQAELQRVQKSGLTDLEVEQAVEAVRARLRTEISDAPNRTAAGLADGILAQALDGRPLTDPRQQFRAYDLAVESVAAADLMAAFKSEWSGSGPLVSVVTPKAAAATEVKEAWLAGEHRPDLPAYVDRKTIKWAYTFEPPGKVSTREPQPLGGFVRLRFENGVVLNFKSTTFRKGYVAFVVRFGSGRRQLTDKDYLTAALGSHLLVLGGVGKHSYEDLEKLAPSDLRSMAVNLGEFGFSFSGSEPEANMSDRLKICAALLEDPAFRPSLDPALQAGAALLYRRADSDPSLAARFALMAHLAPGGPQTLPPEAEFRKVDSHRLADIFRPILTRGPISVTLVGDIDEAAAIKLVANSIGALPPRAPPGDVGEGLTFLRFPAQPPPPLRIEHHGPKDQAFAELNWPLYVATPDRRREEYSIRLLAAIFSDELRRKVRGELGKTYAPTVASTLPDFADQGVLSADIESYPADLDAVVAATRTIARSLAGGDITEAQLEAARAPLLEEGRRSRESNGAWASALAVSDASDANNVGLHDLLSYTDVLTDLRLDDVKKAAADWLSQDPVVVLATPAQAQKSAS